MRGRAVVVLFVVGCGGGDDVGGDAGCPPSTSYCQGRSEDVCEDFDRNCWLGEEWSALGVETAFALREVDGAPSAPRAADVQLPAFNELFSAATLERDLDGSWNTVRVEVSYRNGGLGFRTQQGEFAWLIWMRPETQDVFTIGFGCTPSNLTLSRVSTSAGGGNANDIAGDRPATNTWHRLRFDLTVRPSWSYVAYVDGTLVASGTIPSTLTATNRVRVGFGLELSGPMNDTRASFDDLTIDLLP